MGTHTIHRCNMHTNQNKKPNIAPRIIFWSSWKRWIDKVYYMNVSVRAERFNYDVVKNYNKEAPVNIHITASTLLIFCWSNIVMIRSKNYTLDPKSHLMLLKYHLLFHQLPTNCFQLIVYHTHNRSRFSKESFITQSMLSKLQHTRPP